MTGHPSSVDAEPADPACVYCTGRLRPALTDVLDHRFGNAGRFAFSECLVCRALIAYPLPTDAELARYYESYYTHDELAAPPRALAKLWPLPQRRRAKQAAMTYFQTEAHGRALEVGCGAGERLVALAEQGWEVVGQDIDRLAGRLASDRSIKVHHADLLSCGFPSDAFDLIGLSHVLEHSCEPGTMLSECWRLLAPGGTMTVLGPNAAGFGRRVFGRRWQSLHAPFHVAIPGPSSMDRLACRLGLPAGESGTLVTDH